ncbi:MAG TPA: carboxymuconolactone decarboxylase family protein [Candidatus Mcinerneyibacteriales bacterium]|nr:carboxymuconolactone decarboxylase family protein [Candidatus Mcinerneyibacteriales bacterium]HPE19847.1 carboxymuconolactone decarboxylase family protein [Candidatus Mcinerneyibacteriales bacterium]HPJ69639.1 carboxymuconolactone decarboxylase family protein [Candidatus Mcinerneyibacteriales bacterium]HPQ89229.1 carboxymuconolactone decarboxylase family protein [Candidatus Mcinerneyibacteriales bacterium]
MSSKNRISAFREERERLNEVALAEGGLAIRRFFNLDTAAYKEGALDSRVKELIGLAASLVLRCDDCILYHTLRAFEEGVTDEEYREVMNIGLVVGGSIVIPHLRRAFEHWQELKREKEKRNGQE